MDENQLLTQVLRIEKLEVRGSKIVGTEEIYLNEELMLKVGICPNCIEIACMNTIEGTSKISKIW